MPAQESASSKPLIEQIIHEMFTFLKEDPDVDEGTLTKLRRVAARGGLSRPASVMAAIRPSRGGTDENP
jgi:hypothetical protein